MFWALLLGVATLWATSNLGLYHQRTQPHKSLGLLGSLSIWLWGVYLTVGIGLGAAYRPYGRWLAGSWSVAVLALGLALALLGAIVALWGMWGLRSLSRVSALEEDRLVTSGIYARVRHPQHTGVIVSAFGVAVAFQTLVGLLAAMVVLLWSLVQTRLEDHRLTVLFGDEARRYIRAVPRYFPRVGKSGDRAAGQHGQ